MVLSKLYPERGFACFYTPEEAARDWQYVALGNDPDPRYLDYIKSKEGFKKAGMEFVWRNTSYFPDKAIKDPVTGEYIMEKEVLKKYMNAKNFGICFRVKTKTGGQNWLAGKGGGLFGQPVCNDPWSGKILYKPVGVLSPYLSIDGWLLIRKCD